MKAEDALQLAKAYTRQTFAGSGAQKGEKGDPGKDGKSAYQIWLDAGNVGDEATFLESIKGESGKDGAPGSKGEPGTNGKDGTSVAVKNVTESTDDGGENIVSFSDGASIVIRNGRQGTPGKDGEKGDKGDKGDKGEQGPAGVKGNDGYTPQKGVDYFDGAKGEKGDKGDTGATGAKGEKGDTGATGPRGPAGENGSDASVTVENIKTALGYTPADETKVSQLSEEMVDLKENAVTVTYDASTKTLNISSDSGVTASAVAEIADKYDVEKIVLDGVELRLPSGADGYTPQKGVDYYTDADQEEIVQQVITALGTPVFGRVDTENNIILTGKLADGTYTLKYEDADGNVTTIGTLEQSADAPNYTNQIPFSIDTDGTIYNGVGYKEKARINSKGEEAALTYPDTCTNPVFTTGLMPVVAGDVLRFEKCYIDTNTVENYSKYGQNGWSITLACYDNNKQWKANVSWTDFANYISGVIDGTGICKEITILDKFVSLGCKYIRLTLAPTGSVADAIVTINEEIE